MYQGYRLNWPVESDYLSAQFKTRNGYLLVGSSPSNLFSTFYVDIFYVLGDLSGAEWAQICGIEKLTAIQWIKRAALRVDWDEQPYGSPDGPEPLERTLIEDEATLLIKVRRVGWFRLVLEERNPAASPAARSSTATAAGPTGATSRSASCGTRRRYGGRRARSRDSAAGDGAAG